MGSVGSVLRAMEVEMKIFSGRYSWDGKKHANEEPIAWFPGTYNLKIFDLTTDGPGGVTHLKPFLCIYSKTGEGMSISENPEKFAKHICSEFSLVLDKVLWAEEMPADSGQYEVIVFAESGRLGSSYFYRTSRRKPIAGEIKVIQKELVALT
jgi:hypothetical protein